jgi:hypothetical protein
MIDRNIALFGEPRPPAERRSFSHGPLTAERDGLALRGIRHGGVELLRGIAFIARDDNWATPAMQDIRIVAHPTSDGIRETITAQAALPGGHLEITIDLTLQENEILLVGSAKAHGRLRTNRTGFVLLYPEDCAGSSLEVAHSNGQQEQTSFPRLISPHQPVMDISALTHAPSPGLSLRCEAGGDVFEMEDQRNWSDASFKVYSRPLARPFPYAIEDGETLRQTIRLRVTTRLRAEPQAATDAPLRIAVTTERTGRLPRLGIGGRPADWSLSIPESGLLQALHPSVMMAEADLAPATPDLQPFLAANAQIGGSLCLLARLPRDRGIESLEAVARFSPKLTALALAGATPASLAAARRLFPQAEIGIGTDLYFAEFNRSPPPPGADFAFWTVNPTVHAVADDSVMETLRALRSQVETARAIAPRLPLWCAPLTLRKRVTPHTTRPETNPPAADPRQRGLFGAAFTLGQIAAWAEAGLDTLVLYQPKGPAGLMSGPSGSAIDRKGAGPTVFPLFHILSGLTSNAPLYAIRNPVPGRIAALATEEAVWIANLTADPLEVLLVGRAQSHFRLLDEHSLAKASAAAPNFWRSAAAPLPHGPIKLSAYAVIRVSASD